MSDNLNVKYFSQLFAIKDRNGDDMYRSEAGCTMDFKEGEKLADCMLDREAGLINDALYTELDGRDGVVGNGFSQKDFASAMEYYGLQGLSNFYPNCKFQYNKECGCISVKQAVPLLKENIPYTDERVCQMAKGLFNWSDRPADILESIGGRISHVSYAGEDSAHLVVIEDMHLAHKNAAAVIKTAETLLISRDKLILFQEFIDGPSVFDEAYARKEWNGIKRLIDEAATTSKEDDLRDYQKYDQTQATTKKLVKDELRKLLKKIGKNVLLSIDYSNLKEAFAKYPDLKSTVATLSVGIYLKVAYGDRITILNPEYHKPVNNFDLNEEMVSPLMPSLDGQRFFADDFKTLLAGFKNEVYDHNADQIRLTDTYQRSLQGYTQWVDDRTDRWLQNVLDVISNPEIANGSPPVILLFGGGAHMPKLSKELEGKVSSLFLATDSQ
jgi:hypothetical protein